MNINQAQPLGWRVTMTDPPRLNSWQWNISNLLAIVFLAMAVLQFISFGDFRDGLCNLGLNAPTLWASLVVLAELWAAAGLFKWRLSYLFRAVSMTLALLVAGFWFVVTLQSISNGNGDITQNGFFFGRFLAQTPGWWTVVEATLLLFTTLYVVSISREALVVPAASPALPTGPSQATKAARNRAKTKNKRSH
jgi:hypothetical protein